MTDYLGRETEVVDPEEAKDYDHYDCGTCESYLNEAKRLGKKVLVTRMSDGRIRDIVGIDDGKMDAGVK